MTNQVVLGGNKRNAYLIDPISAITMATSAYNMVTKMVAAGREFEDTAQQLGKWYGAVSDLRRAEQQSKNPPLFKKLFASGSIEEESLAILMHTKKIAEQEKDLKTMLMWRYGANSWDELVTLRRKIAKQREETVYRQQEMRQALLDTVVVIVLFVVGTALIGGIGYWVGLVKGWW
jgi:replicative DNA helicase